MITIDELLRLNPEDFHYNIRVDTLIEWIRACDGYWVHNGTPGSPHAKLTSGKCSNGFINMPKVLCLPNICQIFADQLVRKLAGVSINEDNVDWVIGSPYAAITFSYEIAKALGARHGFAKKDPKDPNGKTMTCGGLEIHGGARVLQVEELVTTSGTFMKVRQAIREENPNSVMFHNIVGSIVHRPADLKVEYARGIKVAALIEKEIWAVDQDACPLCSVGSERLRPRHGNNWAKLTGK